jgi:hypothetical protein
MAGFGVVPIPNAGTDTPALLSRSYAPTPPPLSPAILPLSVPKVVLCTSDCCLANSVALLCVWARGGSRGGSGGSRTPLSPFMPVLSGVLRLGGRLGMTDDCGSDALVFVRAGTGGGAGLLRTSPEDAPPLCCTGINWLRPSASSSIFSSKATSPVLLGGGGGGCCCKDPGALSLLSGLWYLVCLGGGAKEAGFLKDDPGVGG